MAEMQRQKQAADETQRAEDEDQVRIERAVRVQLERRQYREQLETQQHERESASAISTPVQPASISVERSPQMDRFFKDSEWDPETSPFIDFS